MAMEIGFGVEAAIGDAPRVALVVQSADVVGIMEASSMKKNAAQQKVVDAWNANHDVGELVKYWTFTREGEGKLARTRSRAEVLSGHTAVVWLEGVRGCVALSHVEATE